MLDCSPALVAAELTGSLEPASQDLTVGPSAASVRNIAELATIAGVAASTVSRALANKPGVSRKTRDHIKQLAKQHGFCINMNAQRLRAGDGREGMPPPLCHSDSYSPRPDAFILRLLKSIFDQAIRSGFDVSSRRVEIGPQSGPTAEKTECGVAMQLAADAISARTPITIHIMIEDGREADSGVGYCVMLSGQKASHDL